MSAFDVLQDRLAKGEIDLPEFERLKSAIAEAAPPPKHANPAMIALSVVGWILGVLAQLLCIIFSFTTRENVSGAISALGFLALAIALIPASRRFIGPLKSIPATVAVVVVGAVLVVAGVAVTKSGDEKIAEEQHALYEQILGSDDTALAGTKAARAAQFSCMDGAFSDLAVTGSDGTVQYDVASHLTDNLKRLAADPSVATEDDKGLWTDTLVRGLALLCVHKNTDAKAKTTRDYLNQVDVVLAEDDATGAGTEARTLAEQALDAYAKEDYVTALKLYQQLAAGGDANARYQLGRMYIYGDGVPKDTAKALEQYELAAQGGNGEAQLQMGLAYDDGGGRPKDLVRANSYYRSAADQGVPEAQAFLADNYRSGDGVTKDMAEAVGWMTKAANQGYARAQRDLGLFYYHGEGVPKDYAKAAEWVTRAAEQGHASAQTVLGEFYLDGEGVPKDLARGAQWISKAAEQGYAPAQYELGMSYYRGEGVVKDLSMSVKWMTKAAEQGDADAQHELGVDYQNGEGVAKNPSTARAWFAKAKANGWKPSS